AGQLEQLVAEFACGGSTVEDAPVDHELLCAKARPLDKAQRDTLMRTGLDGIDHLASRNCGRIAFALKQEFRVVDAARHVGSEDQQQIHFLGGVRASAGPKRKRSRPDEETSASKE